MKAVNYLDKAASEVEASIKTTYVFKIVRCRCSRPSTCRVVYDRHADVGVRYMPQRDQHGQYCTRCAEARCRTENDFQLQVQRVVGKPPARPAWHIEQGKKYRMR